MVLHLQKVSLTFKSAGSNLGPDQILIPKYQVEPLAHAGMVDNIMYSLWNLIDWQKVYIYVSVNSIFPDEPILGGTPGLNMIHLIIGSYTIFNLIPPLEPRY